MFIPTQRNRLAQLAFALALGAAAVAAPTIASAATVASSRQGLQEWQVLNGKLILVAGTYRDTTSYKRSLTFYFESKPGGAWLHVPVMESDVDHTLSWFSISSGEVTVADAVVNVQGGGVYLIVAERQADKSGITARWYKFSAAGSAYPDGPAYLFAPMSSSSYPRTALAIEDVLKKEASLPPKK